MKRDEGQPLCLAARLVALAAGWIWAPVAKWLTRWSAKPVFMGSTPIRCSNYLTVFESDSIRKAARRRPFSSGTCYSQQLPPSQQVGCPQHGLTVAAEADRDKIITAANTDDRTLIFINSPWFSVKNDTTITKNGAVKCEPRSRISLDSQVVLEIENGRMIAQTWSKLAQSYVN